MFLQIWNFSSVLPYSRSHSYPHRLSLRRNSKKTIIQCLSSDIQIAEIFHNKVLIAATAAAAIGQLSKPFTSIILQRNTNFDVKVIVQPGGFPSSHSSTTVATATTLGLERGFSDPIFGLAVVYACIVMYDSQGVRREVGNHAKALNRAFLINDASVFTDPFSGESSNSSDSDESLLLEKLQAPNSNSSLLTESGTASKKTCSEVPGGVKSYTYLKESVGHTEIEVVAGALLGLFVTLAIYTI